MNWIKRKLAQWVRDAAQQEVKEAINHPMGGEDMMQDESDVHLVITSAENGKIIRAKWMNQPQPTSQGLARGRPWEDRLYLVPEGGNLVEAVTAILISRALTKR